MAAARSSTFPTELSYSSAVPWPLALHACVVAFVADVGPRSGRISFCVFQGRFPPVRDVSYHLLCSLKRWLSVLIAVQLSSSLGLELGGSTLWVKAVSLGDRFRLGARLLNLPSKKVLLTFMLEFLLVRLLHT